MRWSEDQFNHYKSRKGVTKCRDVKNSNITNVKNSNKYKAKITKVGNITFRSQHEAAGYKLLRMYEKTGQIISFVRQPIKQLTAVISWKIDFLVVKNDFTTMFLEYKGYETKDFKLKLKLFREICPHLDLEIVKTGYIWKP